MLEPTTRRRALGLAAGGIVAAGLGRLGLPEPASAADPIVSKGRTKIVVLGSLGGQQVTQRVGANVRCGTSVLIDVDGVLTVLDCGCGSAHRLAEAGYDMSALRHVVITHYHADHISDLGSMASFAWSSGRNGDDAERRLDIFGPTGTRLYESGFKKSMRLSIADQEGPLRQSPEFDRFAYWHEMEPPRKARRVFDDERIEVSAIRVNHGGMPSVGYRVKTPDVDVVFSGDRGATGDHFPAFAKGADAMFHEILARDIAIKQLRSEGAAPNFIKHLINDHTGPQGVARTANEADVGTLVLYHLIPGNPGLPDAYWRNIVEPHYDGAIVVANDLLVV